MKHAALGLLLWALPLSPAFAADCGPLKIVATVPLQPANDQRVEFVPVKLNGVEKKLLLDTGGYVSQLSPQVADELKLPLGGSLGRLRDIRGRESGGTVTVADFEMGNLRAKNIGFQLLPDADMGAAGLNGIIAIDMFLAYDLDLDFGHDTLNFISSDHCDGKVVYWPADAQAEVPMRIVGGHYLMDVTLDGRHLVALLDTGATKTTMGLDISMQYYGLSAASPGMEPGPKVNGALPSYQHKFDVLSFDGVEIHTPTFLLVQSDFLNGRGSAVGSRLAAKENVDYHYDMILGMDIMRHLHLYIATKERKVYITPK